MQHFREQKQFQITCDAKTLLLWTSKAQTQYILHTHNSYLE